MKKFPVPPGIDPNQSNQNESGSISAPQLPLIWLLDPNEGTPLRFIPATMVNGVKVLCCVLGANLLFDVIDGFDLEINEIDKVAMVRNGLFIVRFVNIQDKLSMDSLSKSGSIIGIPIKTGIHSREKSMLQYARLLIKLGFEGPFWEFLYKGNYSLPMCMTITKTLKEVIHGSQTNGPKHGYNLGGTVALDSEIEEFTTCLEVCGLEKMRSIRAYYSWTNKTITSRIDRSFINSLWHDIFDFDQVEYMTQELSDHAPMLFSFPSCSKPNANFMWSYDPRDSFDQLQNLSSCSKLKKLKFTYINSKVHFRHLNKENMLTFLHNRLFLETKWIAYRSSFNLTL
ncbi:LOW QUALITY PROTEIN: hypothetical protein Cgig2_007454 [Carnegiea gigantea]|uniref:Uncharacterized protein n=1 Tax=Carnegiea gigantea TaxID=171969 RepID=A0A9Q1GUM2_9CARY|nr:LOW QUALITY PROTEIN: hypothetical protein Cgig2_007454 [Carnegiea gigantea]